jgi:leader peptidase (prepilin peptidase)/N-methyltransferase
MNTTLIAVMPLVYLAVMAIPLIIIDIREHRLPNKIILPFIVMGVVTDLVASFIGGEWWRLGLALAVAFGIGIVGLVANYFDLIGMGDIKLFFGSSLVIGWFVWWLPIVLVIGTLVIGIVATLYQVVIRKASAGTSVPLGPYAIVLALVIGTYGVMSI